MIFDDTETEVDDIDIDTETDAPTDSPDLPESEDYNGMTATYDPGDNKLRLYSVARLGKETYERIKAMGFRWAPKQNLFVSPKWTPARADMLLAMCGEIGDEDTTLVDRSEQRADRFDGYRRNRERDAQSALKAVEQLANGIPMGQPILVGHHSEKRARRDAKKIERNMGHAAEMWSRREYWVDRAAGAIANAKYKERPDVRHRRIKGLKSDLRKHTKSCAEATKALERWSATDLTLEQSVQITCNHYSPSMCFKLADYPRALPASQYEGMRSIWSALTEKICTVEQAVALCVKSMTRSIVWHERWIEHLENRLAYETAMLGEAGGIKADQFDLQVGGLVFIRREWVTITRINRKDGEIVSVTTNRGYGSVRPIEEIKDYREPTAAVAENVKEATKLAPMCNYRRNGSAELTNAQWKSIYKDHKSSVTYVATEDTERHRVRVATVFALKYAGATVPPDASTVKSNFSYSQCNIPVFITDVKESKPRAPTITAKAEPAADAEVHLPAPTPPAYTQRQERQAEHPQAEQFRVIQSMVRSGTTVGVVSAPQLFPTPAPLATRLIDMADIRPGQRVLEPSSGTGALLEAIREGLFFDHVKITAVEVNFALAEQLRSRYPEADTRCSDFLECTVDEIGQFDRIVMNPPFVDGQDISHILHAATHLAPGGRLVAICANGPRQQRKLRDEEGYEFIDLPAGSFRSSGTDVNAAIVVIEN